MIAKSINDLVGNTPVLQYNGIYIKLEGYNPAGSIKDRVAFEMLMGHQKAGHMKPGDTIITSTSGNTGIGLCLAGKLLGYHVIIVMPENMSIERMKMIKAYGGELVLTDASLGMSKANQVAEELAKERKYKLLDQFSDPFNPLAHKQTAIEIMRDFETLDYVVCGIGSGGTITGLSRYLKEKWPNIKIVGIEPDESPIITKNVKGQHNIQGIGAGFIPKNLDLSLVDEVRTVKSSDALKAFSELGKEGLFLGISSCAAVLVAKDILSQNKDKKILAISPDFGGKYLSVVE